MSDPEGVDLHRPKPVSLLVRREIVRLAEDLVASLRLRLTSLPQGTFIHARARLVHARGIGLGPHCQIHAGASIVADRTEEPRVALGRYTIVREGAFLDSHGGSIRLGEGTFVGQGCVIYGQGGVEVGPATMLAPGVTIITARHGFSRRDIPQKFQEETFAPVCIGSDCWLGARSVVLAGVRIGRGTVVGAGSVVTEDLPDYVVAFGVPAKVRHARPS